MHWQFDLPIIPVFLSALISFIVVWVIWRKHLPLWAAPYTLMMFSLGTWCLAYALEMASVSLRMKLFWTYLQYLGIVGTPVFWYVFISQYTGHEKWMNWRRAALLAIIPLTALLLVWTSPFNDLMIKNPKLVQSGNLIMLQLDHGWFFWLFTIYSYSLLLVTTGLLIITLFITYQSNREQFGPLLMATLVPWIGNAVYVLGLSPLVDLTPVFIAFSGVLMLWSMYRYQFLNIIPVARDAVIEKMVDGMIVVDRSNRVVDLNPAAESIIKQSAKDSIGRPVLDILLDQPGLMESFNKDMESHIEINVKEDEKQFYYDLHVSPLRSSHGDLTGRLVVLNDITERKRLDKAKDEFLSIVTHDLKTPLTVILGYAGALISGMSGEISQQQKGVLEIMRNQAVAQQKMIDTILDYTRIEFGRIKVSPETFSLNALLNEIVDAIKVEAEKKKIDLTSSLPDQEIQMEADRSMVSRIINNLVGNSIKYTPDGGKVNIALELGEGIARITVKDSGIGIEPQNLGKIFDKFFMISSTGAREKRSLGLGLSIVKNFVQAHHGKIWVESEGLGKGSSFIVELPLKYQASA